MNCELLACCQFFNNKMKDLPKSAEYIKDKVCRGEYEGCGRYRIFKDYGEQHVPFYLQPDDTEEVNKVIQCLRKKQKSEKCGNPANNT
jgi:hypothetical protein